MNLVAAAVLACRPEPAGVDPIRPEPAPASSSPWSPSSPAPSSPAPTVPEPELFDCEPITGDGLRFYEDNPTYVDPVDVPFPTATPEDAAMDGALLQQAADALDELPFTWSFLVIRGDALVWESYFHGSDPTASNNVHSASKSILSTCLGIAEAEGLLTVDDPISDLLPERYDGLVGEDLTVRHLLSMAAGLSWQEDRTEYQVERQADWVGAILEQPIVAPPGERFEYSTGNTHVLSALLAEATGESTCAYAHRKLLGPLGIDAEHWARDPQGYYSGGYNLYLTPRELARFGLLALRGGVWEGVEIVPADWLAEAMAQQIGAGGPYGYGLGWWTRPIGGHDTAIAWGWGGQLAYVIPDVDLVVVVTTNTRDYGIDYDAESILERFVIPAVLR